ncbi:MAG: DUF1203 domain-containing protein [Pseudomonadota bacterium]
MSFQIHALPADTFACLFALPDEALHDRDIRNIVADGRPVYPCRVSLQDAVEGERLLLLPYDHHRVDTPYRASGPVYVREAATQAFPAIDDVPALLRSRLLSLRAYDARGMMVWADVVPGKEVEAAIGTLFAIERTAYLHIHYAKPGCYACRVERV